MTVTGNTMTDTSFCEVGVDTSDLPAVCVCGCFHCCTNVTGKHFSPSRQVLKNARPLKHKHSKFSLPLNSEAVVLPQTFKCQKMLNNDSNVTYNYSGAKLSSDTTKKYHSYNNKLCCEICKAEFTRKPSLTLHLQSHAQHQNNELILLKESTEDVLSLPGTSKSNPEFSFICNTRCSKESKLQCKHCVGVYENVTELYNHVIEKHKKKSNQEELNTLSKSISFFCQVCGKAFLDCDSLMSHSSVHNPQHKFMCSTCRMTFGKHSDLQTHSVSHGHRRAFTCAICSAVFVKKHSLSMHVLKHSGERPFMCDICGASFSRRFTLKNHRVLHSGERSHVCASCGKSFSTHAALSAHERNTHSKTPSLPFRRQKDFQPSVCEHCGKVYSNAANLRAHKRTHSGLRPFLCPMCGAAFAKKYTLQCHVQRHTNERPFKCKHCGTSFFRQSTLDSHIRRHTGETPHECKLCGRGFIQSSSLKYHMKHHDHSDTPTETNAEVESVNSYSFLDVQ